MDVVAIVSGVEYDISGGGEAWLEEWDGLGMAELHRLSEHGPLQHGDNDRGFRLDPRFINLRLGGLAASRSGLWDKRGSLLNIFKPSSQPIILRCTLENGDVRQLDCHYFGGMNMASSDRWLGLHQKAGVILKASDPTFYDPAGHSVSINLGGGGGAGFVVPMEVPHEIGATTITASKTIYYDGSWFCYPHIIRITGPITDCVITNETTNEKMDFTGVTIAGNDHYDIDLRFGYKTVRDSNGTNKIADLTGDSDLATFHLAPDPESGEGINAITVTGTGVTGVTNVEINYFDRYIGI